MEVRTLPPKVRLIFRRIALVFGSINAFSILVVVIQGQGSIDASFYFWIALAILGGIFEGYAAYRGRPDKDGWLVRAMGHVFGWSALLVGLVLFINAVGSLAAPQSQNQKDEPPKATAQKTAPQPPSGDELLKLVNEERVKVGVNPLIEDPRLDQSAQVKAQDMRVNNYFDHVDSNGKHGYMYVHDFAPGLCRIASENIYWANQDVASSEDAFRTWLNSPPHYKAMINSEYVYTGFGVSGDSKVYVVEHFCIPN